ncbi:hypothetical protein KDK95_04025 [Actinospica sp. MGRD01-02]|uniref:Uncharacterized protein n=1 Tax=Actinospica acidithermotolerans TaxID=2828514 RepID=A0A941E8I4_9ACTN|nr:hypothetical protein [Actinospica acidithermotolerans]MBR7825460.1 hypothetical protein [Actinospica acidithermotolerans]
MTTMPESFGSMLEELADAAASAVALPGTDAIRRRARERVVHRRMAASALVLVLIGGTGGAWAAVNHHTRTDATAARPMDGASAAPVPAGSPASAAPSASTSTSGGAYAFTSSDDMSIWKTGLAQDGYLMVFSDGVVALSTAGSFPLCYGRLLAADSAAAATPAVLAGVPTSKDLLTDVTCDNFGVTSGLSVAVASKGTELVVTVPSNKSSGAYLETYARQSLFAYGATFPAMFQIPSGTWKSMDGENRTLVVGADGSVSFTAYVNAGKQYTGTGAIDMEYPTGIRAEIYCANGGAKTAPCGVFLIEQNPQTSDELTVYGSYGPETFVRTG